MDKLTWQCVFEAPDVCMHVASFLRVSSLVRLARTAARFREVLRMCVTPKIICAQGLGFIICAQAAVRRRLKAPSILCGKVFYYYPEPPKCGSACSSQCSEGEDDGEEGGGGSSMKRAALPGDT